MHAAITGWGKCLPPAVLSNADLASFLDTSDEWITSHTGIHERRISHVGLDELARVASLRAPVATGLLAEHGFDSGDVDQVVPHQANLRIIEAVARRLATPMDRVMVNVHRYGNMSAAQLAPCGQSALELVQALMRLREAGPD